MRPTTRYLPSLLRRWFHRSEPSRFVGATERFGAELHELRQMEPAPELVSDTEADLNWALAWHEFERQMQDEIEKVFAPLLAAVEEFRDFDELRDRTCPPQLVAA